MSRKPIAPNHRSYRFTSGKVNVATRAMYASSHYTRALLERRGYGAIPFPILDIVSACHANVDDLVAAIQRGCDMANLPSGRVGMAAGNDNTSQGMDFQRSNFPDDWDYQQEFFRAGSSSLMLRNFGAAALASEVRGHGYDWLIAVHFCDKLYAAQAAAAIMTDTPIVIYSAGPSPAHRGCDITAVYDAAGNMTAGKSDFGQACAVIDLGIANPGFCNGTATAGTMAFLGEALFTPPGSACIAANSAEKLQELSGAGRLMQSVLDNGFCPSQFLTKKHFENAAAIAAAVRGSTNAAIHLVYLALLAKIDFTIEDLKRIFRKTGTYLNLRPNNGSKHTLADLQQHGGSRALLKHLIDAGVVDGSVMCITGVTLAEEVKDACWTNLPDGVVAPIGQPFRPYADMQFLQLKDHGDWTLAKIPGDSTDEGVFEGPAMCFTSIDDLKARVKSVKEGTVIVMTGRGPKAIGMPEDLVTSSTLKKLNNLAFLGDCRMSGVSIGKIYVHTTPEAFEGGTIAFIQDGDIIRFRPLDGMWEVVGLTPEMLAERKKDWVQPVHSLDNLSPDELEFCASVSSVATGCAPQAVVNALRAS